jgi:hypothetical protein
LGLATDGEEYYTETAEVALRSLGLGFIEDAIHNYDIPLLCVQLVTNTYEQTMSSVLFHLNKPVRLSLSTARVLHTLGSLKIRPSEAFEVTPLLSVFNRIYLLLCDKPNERGIGDDRR